jgi:ketosteroid isomerase-like protein
MGMVTEQTSSDLLYELLQQTYFDGIDNADADRAVEAFSEDAEWVHTQVWEHDGHDRRHTDILHGRDSIRDFLAARIGEMQVEGIVHKVKKGLCDGRSGAFRAEVIGPAGEALPFFGWVELTEGKISTYIIHPER